ncbi:hypothetical protein ACIGXM_03550 [Kitasatospora sp. NPDC052896]|uniref:hypothetical protein n=1 Tax=Kitasatospora sp. NPDC052896 TaxID=3364061 RepID=UPI0037C6CC6D
MSANQPAEEARGVVDIPVVVEIEGVTPPTVFGRLSVSMDALWASVRHLPLDDFTMLAYQLFLTGPQAVENVIRLLESVGPLSLGFTLSGETRQLKISRANSTAHRDGRAP